MLSSFVFVLVFQIVLCSPSNFNRSISPIISTDDPTPVVLWHGMGDTCCSHGSLGSIIDLIKDQVSSIYVKSIQIGDNEEKDFANGYFMDVNNQITLACESIRSDAKLANGFNLIGFSQGGQFARALVQRCSLPVRNLITFGAQHQGVFGLPRCLTGTNNNNIQSSVCDLVRKFLSLGAYNSFVQKRLVQAQYWHDPLKEETYKEKSLFLADINCENSPRNESYRQNLLNLTNFVLIMFQDDSMVIPKESSHFGYYEAGNTEKIVPLEESLLYTDDRLGLKELNQSGRLIKLTVPGDHLHFSDEWFTANIIEAYLK